MSASRTATACRQAERAVRELVNRVVPGTRIYFPRTKVPGVGYSWNGRHLRPTGLTLESQLHEVAHLLVAHPARRAEPEFGLGPDPYRRNFAPRVCSIDEADREEADACTLQLLLARLLKLDEAAVMSEYATPPLTAASIAALRASHPEALPAPWWALALEPAPGGGRSASYRRDRRPDC